MPSRTPDRPPRSGTRRAAGSSAPSATVTPATLIARDVRFERGGQVVLDGVSLTVGPETCLGVVGPNGVGKSTLLQVLAGLLEPDDGDVRVDPPEATVGYLRQEHDREPAGGDVGRETVREALYRRTGAATAEAELTGAAAALGEGRPGAEDRYATALGRYESLGAADFEARLAGVLEQVGLPAAMAEHGTDALSGGQEARMALAAILLARFDITLLDEPTNDLDFDGLARLEDLVARRRGGMVIVSHDRAFLDGTVTDVLELDEHARRGRMYGGGWAGYLAERASERAHAEESYAVYESQKAELAQRARRERQWATTGVTKEKKNPRDNDKAQRDFRINRTEKLASRARRTERALDALEVVDKPWEGWDLRFAISEATRSGAVVAQLDDAVVERGDFVLGPLTLDLGVGGSGCVGGPERLGQDDARRGDAGPVATGGGHAADRSERRGRRARTGPPGVVGDFVERRRRVRGGDGADRGARPIAAGEVRAGCRGRAPCRRRRCRRASAHAPSWRRSPPRASTSWCSTSRRTIWTCRRSSSSSPALAGYEGTLLLVSHDRRMLETVTVNRRIVLPARDAAFRGLVEDR